MGGGEDDEGDVACGVQEGRLEEADHGDLAEEELHGHVEEQEVVTMRGAARVMMMRVNWWWRIRQRSYLAMWWTRWWWRRVMMMWVTWWWRMISHLLLSYLHLLATLLLDLCGEDVYRKPFNL